MYQGLTAFSPSIVFEERFSPFLDCPLRGHFFGLRPHGEEPFTRFFPKPHLHVAPLRVMGRERLRLSMVSSVDLKRSPDGGAINAHSPERGGHWVKGRERPCRRRHGRSPEPFAEQMCSEYTIMSIGY